MGITENYLEVERRVAEAAARSGRTRGDITLIAVTKTHGPDAINEAIRAGAAVK